MMMMMMMMDDNADCSGIQEYVDGQKCTIRIIKISEHLNNEDRFLFLYR